MKQIIMTLVFLTSLHGYSQTNQSSNEDLVKDINSIKSEVKLLQSVNKGLKSEIYALNRKLKAANDTIEILQGKVEKNTNVIEQTAKQLGVKITTTEQSTIKRIDEVDQYSSKTSLYSIIGVLAAMLVSVIIYFYLSRRQRSDKSAIIEKLSQTKSSIEEGLVKQFGKQTELMETQLQLLEQNKENVQPVTNPEPDHSLVLKVASEINLIERNIKLMDAGTKGLKQLIRSVGKLKDNLAANGYEMPELLGKQFHQGMKIIVTSSIPDENLEKGREVISKVLIPQVNYNDKMIQTGQIEVSLGI